MIWNWASTKHELAIKRWVRFWLGTGIIGRILLTAGVCFILLIISLINSLAALATTFAGVFPLAIFLDLLANISSLVFYLLPPFVLLDAFREWRVTRQGLEKLRFAPDVSAAARAEYLGGHPKLPHGRFVYLTLSGSLEDPQLDIVLPQEGASSRVFSMPVLEVDTVERELVGEDTAETAMLASMGEGGSTPLKHSVLNVKYIGDSGRRHVVQIRNFFGGSAELLNWRNYITCTQAQADTGEAPYGPWKTLPAE